MASSPQNGSATNHARDADNPRFTQTTARSSPFSDASTMISRGGIGRPPPPSQSEWARLSPPQRPRSLAGIALRSFLLGGAFCFSASLAIYLLVNAQPVWRAPFLVASLSVFHFLEFWTTAQTNTASANIASFLLSANGAAYAIAHTLALLETTIIHYFFRRFLPAPLHYILLSAGLVFIIVGQSIRAQAMLKAGKSFSHVVAHTKKTTHVLVTDGIYAYLRHPSYFGYFWWAIGTQLVCGNVVCLVGYVIVLHIFFSERIKGEEQLLVNFFGEEYVAYRARTKVGIPLIK